ncbi:hypothetical protein [Paucisalibacillus globulus]|uniref:hypothetical protein n=1 Tax=Paucisalibacillus globulus TaxID=351095 RepID=UPI0004053888|nr:hypothetical protein [Paucisalibacillus globulus]
MQNFFDEDLCIIILSNNESINQYRLGNAISDILHHIDVEDPVNYKEIPLDISTIKRCCGTYLEDKIEVEFLNGKLYFTRFSGNLHIEIYPVEEGEFVRRYFDQIQPYRIVENEKGEMSFFGFVRKDS